MTETLQLEDPSDCGRFETDTQPIAIVGGGFCGVMTALHLLKQSRRSVVVIEPNENLGRGLAYGTTSPAHLLNVRAAQMSAYPDEPGSLVDWLAKNSLPYAEDSFVPRALYGEYINDQIEGELKHPEIARRFRHIRAEVVEIATRANTQALLTLSDGTTIVAVSVVLALGNLPASPLPSFVENAFSSPFIVNDPWRGIEQLSLSRNPGPLIVIGTGLTAVDWIADALQQGFSGNFIAISRHGLLPRSHAPQNLAPCQAPDLKDANLKLLFRQARVWVQQIEEQGGDWRSFFDAVRPKIQTIWASLPNEQQRQFLRHLRAYWDVHRHRIAPQIAQMLEELVTTSRLQVIAGRIRELETNAHGVELSVGMRGGAREQLIQGTLLVNCTGPGAVLQVSGLPPRSKLLRNLFEQRLILPDAHRMGLQTDPHGAVLDADGLPSNMLFTLGPLLKGELWESIAVRELREQCKALAEYLSVRFSAG